MFKKKKNEPSQIFEIPYSVQINKNNFFLKFIGPCGQSSLSRKKIDKRGYFLFYIDKKKFIVFPINYNNSSPLHCRYTLFPTNGESCSKIQNIFNKQKKIPNKSYSIGHSKQADLVDMEILNKKRIIKMVEDSFFYKLNSENISLAKEYKKSIGFPFSSFPKIKNEFEENKFCLPLNRFSLATPSHSGATFPTKLLKNKIFGVAYGFTVFLQLIGLGYRFSLKKNEDSAVSIRQAELTISAGFSHKIKYLFPLDIHVFMTKFPRNKICLFGIEKEDLLNCSSIIKSVHPPTTYKGKGIRINNETTILRPGKKNK